MVIHLAVHNVGCDQRLQLNVRLNLIILNIYSNINDFQELLNIQSNLILSTFPPNMLLVKYCQRIKNNSI